MAVDLGGPTTPAGRPKKAKDHVSAWLSFPPSLHDVDLRSYFAYARNRLVLRPGSQFKRRTLPI